MATPRPHVRSGARATALVLAAALLLVLLPVASASGQAAPSLSAQVASTGDDFASLAYGDAWDFTNAEDLRLLPDRSFNLANARLEAGEYRFDAGSVSGLTTLVFPGYPGALPMERDGGAIPIDADRFTHVSMRIWSPQTRVMSFIYDRCLGREGLHGAEQSRSACQETTGNIFLQAGWNSVSADLRELTAGRQHPWAGLVYAFRMQVTEGRGYRVQHVRLQSAPATVQISWDRKQGDALYWVRDGGRPEDRGHAGRGGKVAFPAGAHEPGTYRFYAQSDGKDASALSAPLEIRAAPAPFVLDPDLAGGEDYATAHLGRPWDFSRPDDVIASGNITDVSFGPNGLTATNAGPDMQDPYFYVRVGTPIDADRYHRLTVHATYEGRWLVDPNGSGPGPHGRLLWTRADMDQDRVLQGNKVIESRETVHYPGQPSYTVDLKTDPPSFLMETDSHTRNVDGWSVGQPITHLRYDPNEDPIARRWNIAKIELRATDETKGNRFDIRWRDVATTGPATVRLTYRTRPDGPETTIAEGVQQQPGVDNSFRWDTANVPPGRYWVAVHVDAGAGVGSNVSTGPVDVRTSLRIAGRDRLETAVALARTAFPDGARAAVVARHTEFPDALAAAPLAAAADGPLLLNPSGGLAPQVAEELRRLGVRTVYLMGGLQAQSKAVADQIAGLGIAVERISGPNRFDTAVAAAEKAVALWEAGDQPVATDALVALGEDFPDALAAGPLAGHSRRPLLLTGRGAVPQATMAALDRLGATSVTVVGGPGAVSDAAYGQLVASGRKVTRMSGRTRHETAELAARAAVAAGADPKVAVVASGRAFPDALAAGPAVQRLGGVLLLTERDVLPGATGDWVRANSPMRLLRIAGGSGAVSEVVHQALGAAR